LAFLASPLRWQPVRGDASLVSAACWLRPAPGRVPDTLIEQAPNRWNPGLRQDHRIGDNP